ncbi:toll/interleukin-1 receptor domain-containing protein [Akkermansia muciniphila]|uniref:toll/interleukin-1 receptor domain-containing protein n=1 Tax=Akkermansia muciniphila TaxID=239935 RepID=UPI0029E80ED1|nr:toll/interleukin-1 receptor domain-containing protein [Akkermansia muciniphila]WPK65534.1 toll/interleukin-1 receptor domain-containing protein [Akkermansia muciniphila]
MSTSLPYIFISWKGEEELYLATLLKNWLEKFFQLEVFISVYKCPNESDWQQTIRDAVGQSDFGIVMLSERNKEAPWIMYETGLLDATHKYDKLAPVLIDVEVRQQPEILRTRQVYKFDEEGIMQLFRRIKNNINPNEREKVTIEEFIENEFEYNSVKIQESKERLAKTYLLELPSPSLHEEQHRISKTINDVLTWKKVPEITLPYYKKIINGEEDKKKTSDPWVDVYVSEPFVDKVSHMCLTPLLLHYTFFDRYVKDGYKLFFLNEEGNALKYEYEMSNNKKFILKNFYKQYLNKAMEAQAPFPFSPDEEEKQKKAKEAREKAEYEKRLNRLQRAKRLIPECANLEEGILNTLVGSIIFSNGMLDTPDDFKFIEQIGKTPNNFNSLFKNKKSIDTL